MAIFYFKNKGPLNMKHPDFLGYTNKKHLKNSFALTSLKMTTHSVIPKLSSNPRTIKRK